MIQHQHQLILLIATEIGGNLGSEILTLHVCNIICTKNAKK